MDFIYWLLLLSDFLGYPSTVGGTRYSIVHHSLNHPLIFVPQYPLYFSLYFVMLLTLIYRIIQVIYESFQWILFCCTHNIHIVFCLTLWICHFIHVFISRFNILYTYTTPSYYQMIPVSYYYYLYYTSKTLSNPP